MKCCANKCYTLDRDLPPETVSKKIERRIAKAETRKTTEKLLSSRGKLFANGTFVDANYLMTCLERWRTPRGISRLFARVSRNGRGIKFAETDTETSRLSLSPAASTSRGNFIMEIREETDSKTQSLDIFNRGTNFTSLFPYSNFALFSYICVLIGINSLGQIGLRNDSMKMNRLPASGKGWRP